jgi:hypothetical protein
MQYSHSQAFMNCPDGLSAGTYNVTLGATWGNKSAVADSIWQFTLTQAVPAGGRLSGFESMPDKNYSSWRIKSWASPSAADPIETVTVSSGSDGTSLGIMNLATISEDGLNCMQATGYGRSRWSTSALRQYLNSSGTGWWQSKGDFDIRPDQYDKNGFMSGFGSDFLAAIKPVKVTTALNTLEGYDYDTEDTYDTFFLPSLEQMNVNPQIQGVEGEYFEYWRSRLGVTGFVGTDSSNTFDAFKIAAINSNTPQSIFTRSCSPNHIARIFHVNSAGYVAGQYPSSAFRFAPICVIC